MDNKTAARGLGLVSLAIGLSEILLPKKLERTMGIGNGVNTRVLRLMGVRELMQGFDILTHGDPAPGMWARVIGDVLDTALLGVAARQTRRAGAFALVSAMVLGIGIADVLFASKLRTEPREKRSRSR